MVTEYKKLKSTPEWVVIFFGRLYKSALGDIPFSCNVVEISEDTSLTFQIEVS